VRSARQRTALLAILAALAVVATVGCSFIVGVSQDPVLVADGDAADASLGPDTLEAASVDPDADAVDAAGDAPDDAAPE
jgi:hypothetical protein